ncbi:hypothetical protein CK934_25935 [Chitinophaga sp. MD30]|nr:hypothetical protein CK934_25935 [Chitinophaga sp. MD30]
MDECILNGGKNRWLCQAVNVGCCDMELGLAGYINILSGTAGALQVILKKGYLPKKTARPYLICTFLL